MEGLMMTLREKFEVAVGKGLMPPLPVCLEVQELVERMREWMELVDVVEYEGFRAERRRERFCEADVEPGEYLLCGRVHEDDELKWDMPIPMQFARREVGQRLSFDKTIYKRWFVSKAE